MEGNIPNNYSRIRPFSFVPPVLILIAIVLSLYSQGCLRVDKYIQIQKHVFLFVNHNLGQYPSLQLNLTQLGDTLVFLSLISVLIVYVPQIRTPLIWSLLASLVFSVLLKNILAIPRPAAVFDHGEFIILGKTLTGHNSCPSGHSITTFTILTVLSIAFMPQKLKFKMLWIFMMLSIGLIIVSTRVGVGAHYPLDVFIGSTIGYISGLTGIFISQQYKAWPLMNKRKYYLIFVVAVLGCCVALIGKIIQENLIIFYFSFASLVVTLFKAVTIYVKN